MTPDPPENSPKTTTDMMRALFEIRTEKEGLEAQIKALNERATALETDLLAQMEEQGATRIGVNGLGLAIKTTAEVPVVEDWDQLYAYIHENDAFHLLQRRVSSTAYRELIASGEALPGVRSFEKVSLNLRGSK